MKSVALHRADPHDARVRLLGRAGLGMLAGLLLVAVLLLWLVAGCGADAARWVAFLQVEGLAPPDVAHARAELAYAEALGARLEHALWVGWALFELAGVVVLVSVLGLEDLRRRWRAAVAPLRRLRLPNRRMAARGE